jgi:drug/metabolite transporter (DMT)-like permease
MATHISRLDWALFFVLSLLWGSSYLFIKIGIESLSPFTLIACRLGIATVVLGLVLAVAREKLPRDRATYAKLVVMALLNIVLPFSLIAWGERYIDSGLAALLQAITPLFTLILAALALDDERITLNRLVGLAIGFGGVTVLVSHSLGSPAGDQAWIGDLALIGSSVGYAAGNVFVRSQVRGLRPMVPAFFQVSIAFVIIASLALVFERPIHLPSRPEAILAVTWLGVLGSACAYLIYFRLVHRLGPTRLSLITYLMPIVGVSLGVLVLGETFDSRVFLAAALILGGVALANVRLARFRPGRHPAGSPAALAEPAEEVA